MHREHRKGGRNDGGVSSSVRESLVRERRRLRREVDAAKSFDDPVLADVIQQELDECDESIAHIGGKHHRDNSRS